jgi:hypothetical protein
MKNWLKLLIFFLSLGILYISFVRADLENVIKDEKSDNLRKVVVSFGDNSCYKLPETRTLPNNPLYGIKEIRNELWIKFSNKPLDKVRVTLLVADKKMEEAIVLNQKGEKKSLVIKTSQEAVEKLKSASDLISKMDNKDIEIQKVQQKIDGSTLAYKKIIDSFEIDDKNQQGLFKLIDTCND